MKYNLLDIGKITAFISFVIGTCLLSFFLYFGDNFVSIGFAIVYIIIALIINSILFTLIIIAAILNKTDRFKAFKTCLVMLANIPVSMLYFFMVITFK